MALLKRMKKPMPEINMIFQCSLEMPALSISEKSLRLVSIDVVMGYLATGWMPASITHA